VKSRRRTEAGEARLRAQEQYHDTPVAIVTGDYSLDDTIARELDELGAELRFKPLWFEDLIALAHSLLATNRGSRPHPAVQMH
jgi:DNA-binding response OmpR family regulator